MNDDAIIARLAALEILAGSCLTFLLASAGNDPELSKAKAILDTINSEANSGLAHLPPNVQAEAKTYLTNVTGNVMKNKALRGMSATKQ
jgi:hypothetical protein